MGRSRARHASSPAFQPPGKLPEYSNSRFKITSLTFAHRLQAQLLGKRLAFPIRNTLVWKFLSFFFSCWFRKRKIAVSFLSCFCRLCFTFGSERRSRKHFPQPLSGHSFGPSYLPALSSFRKESVPGCSLLFFSLQH